MVILYRRGRLWWMKKKFIVANPCSAAEFPVPVKGSFRIRELAGVDPLESGFVVLPVFEVDQGRYSGLLALGPLEVAMQEIEAALGVDLVGSEKEFDLGLVRQA